MSLNERATIPILQDLGPNRQEALWLAAAACVARRLPLFLSPISDEEDVIYSAVENLARDLAGPEMRKAEDQLNRSDELVLRTAPPTGIEPPSDSACELYTPKIDAAYFIGLAVGVRLGRALEGRGAGEQGAR